MVLDKDSLEGEIMNDLKKTIEQENSSIEKKIDEENNIQNKNITVNSPNNNPSPIIIEEKSNSKKFQINIKLILNSLLFIGFLFLLIGTTYITTFVSQIEMNLLGYIQSISAFRFVNIILIGQILQFIILVLYFDFAVFLFPLFNNNLKYKIFKPQPWILLFVILGIFVYSLFNYSSTNEGSYYLTQTYNKTTTSFSESIKNFMCYFNQDCLTKKLNSKTSVETNRVNSEINFNPPYLDGLYLNLDELKNSKVNLNYEFKDLNNIKLNSVTCYLNSINNKTAFQEIPLNINSNNEDFYNQLYTKLNCDLSKAIPLIDTKKNNTDETIFLNLNFVDNTTITIDMPVFNEKVAFPELKSKYPFLTEPLKYPNSYVSDYTKYTLNKDVKVIVPSNSIIAILENSKNKFPLIFGNSENDEINLVLDISPNDYSNLGEIKKLKINKIDYDHNYFELENYKIYEKKEDDKNNYVVIIKLKEKDNAIDNNPVPILISSLNVNINVEYSKIDSFSFYLTNSTN
jgi:hypothetical protein